MELKKLLWVKAEVSYGVDPTAAAADVVWAENPVFTPKGQRVGGDPSMAGLGGIKDYMYGQYGELTFEVPLGGSGTAGTAPKWGKLLLACGWAETISAGVSVTYALAANPAAGGSVAITFRQDRRKHVLSGARGMVSFSFDEGKRPVAKFTFRGLLTAVADGAVIAHSDATWTGHNDIDPVSQAMTTFAFNSVNAPVRSLSFDQSDNVVFSDRPNQKQVDLAGARTWSGKLKISSQLPSVLNLESLAIANTLVTSTLVHGTTGGKILTVTAKSQLAMPTYSDDKGLDVTDVDLMLKPSAMNLDDQIALVCT